MKHLKRITEGFNDNSEFVTISLSLTKTQFAAICTERGLEPTEELLSQFEDWMSNALDNAGIDEMGELEQFLSENGEGEEDFEEEA